MDIRREGSVATHPSPPPSHPLAVDVEDTLAEGVVGAEGGGFFFVPFTCRIAIHAVGELAILIITRGAC